MTFFEGAGYFLRWWASTLILGLALWPIVFQCLKRLPDRGWSFARMAGILFTGYFFWLGCWLKLWTNGAGAVWLCAAALFLAGTAWAHYRGADPWRWLRDHFREALFTEAVFFILLAGLTWIRSYDAGATHTERPMDLAFLNAILRSEYFPPNDPWLSGYAISYYHFGYILTGMLAKITGIAGGVAFSLGVTGSLSMAGLGAYGILRNVLLLKAQSQEEADPVPAAPPESGAPGTAWRKAAGLWTSHCLWWPLMAPFTLLFLGNFEGGLEILYAQHVGWDANWEAGRRNFWTELDIEDINSPPIGERSLTPNRSPWWWWAASRVVNDRALSRDPARPGAHIEVIDEFPAFSFVIGDMHPHVMALPFLLLAAAVVLETLLRGGGALEDSAAERRTFAAFSALAFGSLLFLNTWDILIFGMAAAAGWFGWKMSRKELAFGPFSGWKAYLARWALIGAAAVALFVPFLIGFSSQAGGILPNVLFPTKGGQHFVMFGTLFIPLFAWIILEIHGRDRRWDWKNGLTLAGIGIAVLVAGSLMLGFSIALDPTVVMSLADVLGGYGAVDALSAVLMRRIADPWATLLPLLLIASALAALFGWIRRPGADAAGDPVPGEQSAPGGGVWAEAFLLILVFWGALLALGPEYFYLRDFFGGRMNTVFKFYFQAWAFLSLPAAYGAVRLTQALREKSASASRRRYAAAASAAVFAALIAGSVYFPMAVWTKTRSENYSDEPTLDASAYLRDAHPADAAAIAWIRQNIHDNGPLVEAVGNDYDEYAARVSTHTGIPGLLGWIGHEDQWRGTRAIHAPRIADVEQLYRTTDWYGAQEILDRYGIRYVYFGPLEERLYGTRGLEKFRLHLNVIYEADGVIIFERGRP
ncbi:MAG: hypothetical protein JW929_11225 [Anaerolineales bacterium]|nr:hypothetical protein [Anaerolineales bacterium]